MSTGIPNHVDSSRDSNHRLRITIILEGIEPTQKAAADVARTIQCLASRFKVTILTSRSEICRRTFPNATVLRLPSLPFRAGIISFFFFSFVVQLFLRCDLIYVAGVINCPGVVGSFGKTVLCYGNSHPIQQLITSKRKGGKLSALVGKLYEYATIAGLRRCDRILSISPQLTRVYQSLGLDESKIAPLEIGVPLETFNPPKEWMRTRKGTFVATYHGTVSVERGLGIMIEGARIVGETRRDFLVKLVGCSPNETELASQLISKARVEDLFEIRPPVPHSEIPQVLWDSDVGISLLEPNEYFECSPPVKVLEFLASGLPVIANDIKTHRLYLADRVNCLLIDYSAESFASAMMELMNNPDFAKELGANALAAASRFPFSMEEDTLIQTAEELMMK